MFVSYILIAGCFDSRRRVNSTVRRHRSMLKNRHLFLIWAGVAVVVSICFLLVAPKIYRNSLRAKAKLENELTQITPPPGATFVHHYYILKMTSGVVSDDYRGDLSYDQIRAHYDKELAAHGWSFRAKNSLTTWGKDLGKSETIYCRGNEAADIFWTGTEQTRQRVRFVLSLKWGSDHCN